MKIFSSEQVREWDKYTIENEPVSSIDLMERASQKCTDWLFNQGFDQHSIKIFCGKGNNGGDGLAIARQLIEQGIFVRVYILEFGHSGTADFQENLHRLHQYTNEIYFIQHENSFPAIKKEDVVIDAIYGTGLNRPLNGLSAKLVEFINCSEALIISIDVPSGMFADKSSKNNIVILATFTLTFQSPKICFLLPENEAYTGDLQVMDIGLHKQYESETSTPYYYIDETIIQSIYKPRKKFSHKGTFGHALIIGGSKGKIGAAYLSARGCLKSGAGLLTTLIPTVGLNIMQTLLPEAMCITTDDTASLDFKKYAAIGIGPGLGTQSSDLIKLLLEHYKKPVVFDADALNILSQHPDLLSSIPPGSILTPHPKEYERLFGTTSNEFERLENAMEKARTLQSYIIIKGHYSFIACKDGTGYFNSTGNAGMATGGSGDVLTGIITGLLSCQYSSKEAAILGVYIHGLAGDIAATAQSQEALIAGDITDSLGEAFKQIIKNIKMYNGK